LAFRESLEYLRERSAACDFTHPLEFFARFELRILEQKTVGREESRGLPHLRELESHGDQRRLKLVMKKCGNCLAAFGKCSVCREKYPHGTAAHCSKPACASVPVECQCGLLVAEDLSGVFDLDQKLVPWSLTDTF
jgi:hypothetical protein